MENAYMMREKSMRQEKVGRARKDRPIPVRELILRQVLPWPKPDSKTGWDPSGAAWFGQLLKADEVRPTARAVRIEIVIDPWQARRLLELLRHILASSPQPTVPSCTGQNGALPTTRAFDLTPREGEVLEQVIEGKSNRQIALELEIAASTVKCHVSNILSKMGAESRTEAATMALKQRALDRSI